MNTEIWRDVPGYDGLYLVSNFGAVKSVNKSVKSGIKNNPKRFIPGKIMRQFADKDGYYRIGLTKNHKKTFVCVHILQCRAFYPNPENKPQVNHKNGIKSDNRIENLEWATLSENRTHAYNTGLQNGLSRRGRLNNFVKLNEKQVIEIRQRYTKGTITMDELSKDYGVTDACIQRVLSKKTWAWL